MSIRLQRVRTPARWDRPRAMNLSRYFVVAVAVWGVSYEVWIIK